MNPKISPNRFDPKITPNNALYTAIEMNKTVTLLLELLFNYPYLSTCLHIEDDKKNSLKSIACRNPDLACKKMSSYTPIIPTG